jgi:hypothetical protein
VELKHTHCSASYGEPSFELILVKVPIGLLTEATALSVVVYTTMLRITQCPVPVFAGRTLNATPDA